MRATAAHNTVEVDAKDQCVFLGPFRATHLPRVSYRIEHAGQDHVVVAAEHDGYRRLPEPVTHRRTFCWLPGDGLVVVDALKGDAAPTAASRIHLAPGAAPLRIRPLGEAPVRETTATVAPYLAVLEDAPVLEQTALDPAFSGWSLLRSDAAITREGDEVVVRRDGHADVAFPLP
jgi:hypothetical protein